MGSVLSLVCIRTFAYAKMKQWKDEPYNYKYVYG